MTTLIKVLRPTGHKIGHFGDVPQASLCAWYGKTTRHNKSTHSPIKTDAPGTITPKKLKPGLVAFMTSGLEMERAYPYFGTS